MIAAHPSAKRRAWQGIEASEPPLMARDYPQLLAMAESMLLARRDGFPDRVARGNMTGEAAAEEIAVFEAIVADWTFIVTGEGEPASLMTLCPRRDALDESLSKLAAIAREQGGFSSDLEAKTQAVIALRWHLEPRRETVALARLTHRLRGDARAQNEDARKQQKETVQ